MLTETPDATVDASCGVHPTDDPLQEVKQEAVSEEHGEVGAKSKREDPCDEPAKRSKYSQGVPVAFDDMHMVIAKPSDESDFLGDFFSDLPNNFIVKTYNPYLPGAFVSTPAMAFRNCRRVDQGFGSAEEAVKQAVENFPNLSVTLKFTKSGGSYKCLGKCGPVKGASI